MRGDKSWAPGQPDTCDPVLLLPAGEAPTALNPELPHPQSGHAALTHRGLWTVGLELGSEGCRALELQRLQGGAWRVCLLPESNS